MKIVIHDRMDEMKAINFYRSDEDITYMLKNRTEVDLKALNDSHKDLMRKAKGVIQEEFTKAIDIDAYNKFYRDVSTIVNKESRLNTILRIEQTLMPLKQLGFRWGLDEKNKELLRTICESVSLKFLEDDEKMLELVLRARKGIENDIKRLSKKLESESSDFKFIREFMKVKKTEGYSGSSLEITLAEWAELYKSAVENSKTHE